MADKQIKLSALWVALMLTHLLGDVLPAGSYSIWWGCQPINVKAVRTGLFRVPLRK